MIYKYKRIMSIKIQCFRQSPFKRAMPKAREHLMNAAKHNNHKEADNT